MKIVFNKYDKTMYPYLDDSVIGNFIPIAYGKLASIKLQCVNTAEDVNNGNLRAVYRLPDGISNYGSISVKSGDTYISGTSITVDYIAKTISVNNGREASGSTREAKLTTCYGYMFSGHSYPKAVIEHFLATYGNIQYTESNYNTTVWESEMSHANLQCDISFLLDSETDLWEHIYKISAKAEHLFRVYYDNAGKIWAHVKDFDRVSSRLIASVDIRNADSIKLSSDRSGVYSSTLVKYFHNYAENVYLSVLNTTYINDVRRNYRKENELSIESYLVNKADAEARAYEDATRLADVPMVAQLELYGNTDINIYEVLTVTLQQDNLDSSTRVFAGNKDCLVLSINPDLDNNTNSVSVLIISDRVPAESQSSVRSEAYTNIERAKSSIELVEDDLVQTKKVYGYLTLPTINLYALSDGNVSDYSLAVGTFRTMFGLEEVTTTGAVYSLVSYTAGVTASINASTGQYSVTAITANTNAIVFRSLYEGVEMLLTFVVTKAVQGDEGIQGSAGTDGTDGDSLYTWIKYADTPTTGMSDSPDGKDYFGIAYNKTTPTESNDYADYDWSLTAGTDGVNGVDGTTTYTWVKYADDASGTGMSDSPAGKSYIGLAFNKTTATESTTPSDYAWSLIKGADGTSVRILGSVADYTFLPSSGNTIGDVWIVIASGGGYNAGDGAAWSGTQWSNIGALQGAKGDTGDASYLFIRYSAYYDGTDFGTLADKYIGTAITTVNVAPTDKTSYTWSILIGSFTAITNVYETTGTYATGQYGDNSGHTYQWTRTGSGTGYWTLVPKSVALSLGMDTYLSMDEPIINEAGSLTIVDNSGSDNSAKAYGTTIVMGYKGNALSLASASSYIEL